MTVSNLRRDQLPDWESYVERTGMQLRRRGSQLRGACLLHGGERDSFTANVDGPWLCQSCQARGGDVLAFHQQLHGLPFPEAARDLGGWGEPGICAKQQRPQSMPTRHRTEQPAIDDGWKLDRALTEFERSRPISGDPDGPAGQYLRLTRKLELPRLNSDLRWMPRLQLFGFNGPALVSRMSLAVDGNVMRGLHLTWLQLIDGRWRRAERRYLGPKAGCVVRITADDEVTYGLGIGEGIESSMSLALAGLPVWACLDAGNLAAFALQPESGGRPARSIVLEGIETLTIAADNDLSGTGRRAAEACAARWHAAGRHVRIVMPDEPNQDLNDVAVAR